MSARPAVARVEPVSPSPDFASSAFRSSSDAIKISQHVVRNALVSPCEDAGARTGDNPSGSGRIAGVEMDLQPGPVVLGMVMDTLSGRSPLYRLENFFEEKDIELLLGEAVSVDQFSDHNIGRGLDKIFETGTQKNLLGAKFCNRPHARARQYRVP